MSLRIQRVYGEEPSLGGRRYLIDGLWPRGFRKEDLRLTEWLKELAPSPALRRWFGHDPARYPEFRRRFRDELAARSELLARLEREARVGPVTLLFAARDEEHCNASVLAELLRKRLRSASKPRRPEPASAPPATRRPAPGSRRPGDGGRRS